MEVMPLRAASARTSSMPRRRSAGDGAAILLKTRFIPATSCRKPVGSLVCASRTMWPPAGCAVFCVTPASCSARDFAKNQVHSSDFLQETGGFVGLRVANDVAARGLCGVLRHAGQLQREGICDGYVAIYAREEHRIRCGNCIKVGARGIAATGPERLVPSEAGDPFAGGAVFYGCANALLKFGERLCSGEINGELGERGLADVHVRVVESGHDERAMQIKDAFSWA